MSMKNGDQPVDHGIESLYKFEFHDIFEEVRISNMYNKSRMRVLSCRLTDYRCFYHLYE